MANPLALSVLALVLLCLWKNNSKGFFKTKEVLMKVKSVFFSLFVVAAFIGFVSVGVTHALSFLDWGATWFSVQVSETGKEGSAPTSIFYEEDKPYTNNEKAITAYLYVDQYFVDTASFDVVYCVLNGTRWVRNEGLQWTGVGGKPDNFLAFFSVSYGEPDGRIQSYWIPLNVKGEESNNNAGEITSGSFKNLGGAFTEVRTDVTGMGEVKFKGTFMDSNDVESLLPDGCKATIP